MPTHDLLVLSTIPFFNNVLRPKYASIKASWPMRSQNRLAATGSALFYGCESLKGRTSRYGKSFETYFRQAAAK